MDLNKEIQTATDAFIEEQLPAMVSQKVGKMVDDILTDVFRSYSDTAKLIKAKIEQHLDINLQKFDMVDYNGMVSQAINDQLVGLVNSQAIAPISELIKETVGFVQKKEIRLSEIHQMFIEAAMEDTSEMEGEIYFTCQHSPEYGWHTIAFGLEKDDHDCIEFTVSKDGNIFCFRAKSWASPLGRMTPAKITNLSRLEHKIFRLYSAGVKVTDIDTCHPENCWSRYD